MLLFDVLSDRSQGLVDATSSAARALLLLDVCMDYRCNAAGAECVEEGLILNKDILPRYMWKMSSSGYTLYIAPYTLREHHISAVVGCYRCRG